MLTARVSSICDYHWWRANSDEFDLGWDWFMAKDRSENERMRVGKALHSYLEKVASGKYDGGTTDDGYAFSFECDATLHLPNLREFRTYKQYGDLNATGQCDAAGENRLCDFKFTLDSIDMEQYMESYQWRFYLDMFARRQFDYMVFRAYETKDPKFYKIVDIQQMSVFAYPEMHRDCLNLATEFYDTAIRRPELVSLCNAGVEAIRA